MHASVADKLRRADDDELLRLLQETPEEWSEEALEVARAELQARGVAWEDRPAETSASLPLWVAAVYCVIGLVGGVVALILVFGYGVSPRWLILVAALMGLTGAAVPREPRRSET